VIVASAVCDDPLVKALTETKKVPWVLMGRHPYNADISYVDIDNLGGAEQAVEHLLSLGNCRVATITGPQGMVAGIDRYAGYQKALARHNIDLDLQLVAHGDFSEEGGYRAMQGLIQQRPDAVFVASDMMAIGAMRAIQEAGLKIPEQIAVVGFDDVPGAARTVPALTTVHQPTPRAGAELAEMLIDMIGSPQSAPRRLILSAELVVRGSCGARH
jgi:LacI family transcriptional regulator